jgi:small subunit ribosomal protein S6
MAKAKKNEENPAGTYEAMFLFGSGHTADAEAAMKLARGIVERHEGKIIVIKKWDERKLAYEIRGEKRGLYVIAFFTAPPPAITAVMRDVELSDDILRVMVTKADHLNAEEMAAVEPQPIQPREERNPWDRPAWEDRPSGPPRRDRPPMRSGRGEESAEPAAKE